MGHMIIGLAPNGMSSKLRLLNDNNRARIKTQGTQQPKIAKTNTSSFFPNRKKKKRESKTPKVKQIAKPPKIISNQVNGKKNEIESNPLLFPKTKTK